MFRLVMGPNFHRHRAALRGDAARVVVGKLIE
jgi:hypothetical protein